MLSMNDKHDNNHPGEMMTFDEYKRSSGAKVATQRKLLESTESLARLTRISSIVSGLFVVALVFSFAMLLAHEEGLWLIGIIGSAAALALLEAIHAQLRKRMQARIVTLRMIRRHEDDT